MKVQLALSVANKIYNKVQNDKDIASIIATSFKSLFILFR